MSSGARHLFHDRIRRRSEGRPDRCGDRAGWQWAGVCLHGDRSTRGRRDPLRTSCCRVVRPGYSDGSRCSAACAGERAFPGRIATNGDHSRWNDRGRPRRDGKRDTADGLVAAVEIASARGREMGLLLIELPTRISRCSARANLGNGAGVVDFNQSNPGCAVHSAHERGVVSGSEGREKGRLFGVGASPVSAMVSAFGPSCQSSFDCTRSPLPSCNSRNGSARGLDTPALPNDGPIARATTVLFSSRRR